VTLKTAGFTDESTHIDPKTGSFRSGRRKIVAIPRANSSSAWQRRSNIAGIILATLRKSICVRFAEPYNGYMRRRSRNHGAAAEGVGNSVSERYSDD
jgi:hypothetical protein